MGNRGWNERAICARCGRVLGVYEPLVAVGREGLRTTSFAAEPDLLTGGEIVMHAECSEASPDDSAA